MKHADLKVIRSTAPLRGKRVTVLTPAIPPRRLFAGGEWDVFVDHLAAQEMALLCSLAASSADKIVWIPTSGEQPAWCARAGFEPCDLVFCHHSIQLPMASWKEMRSYARKGGRAQTLSAFVPNGTWWLPNPPRLMHTPPGEDVADLATFARTVFVVGSAPLFRHLAQIFADMLTANATGDHAHLRDRARKLLDAQGRDLTVCYVTPDDWA